MLRLFSSIRKSLLAENKTVRYLKYAVGEIVLIMLGIFLALQLNNWNEGRKDRIEEREILRRISKEVDLGIADMRPHLDALKSKQEALNRLALKFEEQTIGDPVKFVSDVTTASQYGRGYPEMQMITFEEFVSAGKLGLIQNIELRTSIMGYYTFANSVERMALLRIGEFANIVYDLVPQDRGSFLGIKEGLLDSQYESIAKLVLESDLNLHLNREENRSSFLERRWEQFIEDGIELLDLIEAELADN